MFLIVSEFFIAFDYEKQLARDEIACRVGWHALFRAMAGGKLPSAGANKVIVSQAPRTAKTEKKKKKEKKFNEFISFVILCVGVIFFKSYFSLLAQKGKVNDIQSRGSGKGYS